MIREIKIIKIMEQARSFALLHQMIERSYATFNTFEKSSRREIGRAKCFLSFPTTRLRPCPDSLGATLDFFRIGRLTGRHCLLTNLVRLSFSLYRRKLLACHFSKDIFYFTFTTILYEAIFLYDINYH